MQDTLVPNPKPQPNATEQIISTGQILFKLLEPQEKDRSSTETLNPKPDGIVAKTLNPCHGVSGFRGQGLRDATAQVFSGTGRGG